MPTRTPAEAGAGGNAGELETPSHTTSPAPDAKFGVTLGRGRKAPQGSWRGLPVWSAVSLAEVLRNHTGLEAWFSLSCFRAGRTNRDKAVADNYRDGGTFCYAVGCGADVDTEGHRALTPEERTILVDAAKAGKLPGDLFYLTQAGCRLLRIFAEPVYNPDDFRRLAAEFEAEVADALDSLGFSHLDPDPHCTGDRARFFYTPNCTAKGQRRKAEVLVLTGANPQPERSMTGNTTPAPTRKPRQGVVGVSRVSGVKKGIAPLNLSADERAQVEAAISSTLPATFNTRNACLLMFLRRLKAIPGVASASGAQLRPFVEDWWRRSRSKHRDANFSETWQSAVCAWPATIGGEEFLSAALAKADEKSDPFAQLVTDTLALADVSSFHRFVGLLCQLDRASDGKVWFLSNDKAGELLGVAGKTAHRWFKILVVNRVLIEVEPPKKRQRRAARYKLNRDWTPPETITPMTPTTPCRAVR